MGNECALSSPRTSHNESAFIEFDKQMPRFRGHFNFEKQSAYNKIQAAAKQFCFANGIDRGYTALISRLLAYNQHHYFAAFKTIPPILRQKFIQNLGNLQVQLMDSLFTHLILHQHRHLNPHQTIQNVSHFIPPPKIKYNQIKIDELRQCQELGFNLLWKRKVAVMIMISGEQQMQKLTSKALQILPIEGAPCRLQYMLSKLYNNLNRGKEQPLMPLAQPIIIACNQINQEWIRKFFIFKKYFGFDEKLVKITSIKNLPIVNEQGKLCLSFEYRTIMYPEGSAKCLQLILDESTRLKGFLNYNKVEYIHVVDCESQFQCPGDPIFVGLASVFDRRMLAKCTAPSELYQGRMRYVCSQTRLHLLDMKQLQYLNDFDLIKTAPVALNSMLFQLNWLLSLSQNLQIELALSRRYHPKEIYCNYYDFAIDRPVIDGKCYAFQKDIKEYICTTEKAQLIEYDRAYFERKHSGYLFSEQKNSSLLEKTQEV